MCGDPTAPEGSPESMGVIRLLDEKFGSTLNGKGYKVLDPHVGILYGDGMYYDRFNRTLTRLREMGYASSNLVIGIGGLLLQQHNRDDQGFSIKATFAIINGESVELMKDPITDRSKRSHKGLLRLGFEGGTYATRDQVSVEEEQGGVLSQVFMDGEITKRFTLDDLRSR